MTWAGQPGEQPTPSGLHRSSSRLRLFTGAALCRPCLERTQATTGQYAHAQSGWLPAQYAQSSSPSAQQPAGLRDGELARCHARPLEALPGGYDCSLASAQHGVGMTDVGRALPGTGMHSMYSNPA